LTFTPTCDRILGKPAYTDYPGPNEMATNPRLQSLYLKSGIEHCRRDRWEVGLNELSKAFREGIPIEPSAGIACSYYGYALARCEGSLVNGLELCRQAVRLEPGHPEVYLNLALTHLLAGSRRKAVAVREQGLRFDPEHKGLLGLRQQMRVRRPAVVSFLGRDHPVNIALGRLRDRLKTAGGSTRPSEMA
jgi:tetratricopeptide (TPR) repeat protein